MLDQRSLPPYFLLNSPVAHARRFNLPVVALESAVITHGLPRPVNLELARALETIIVEQTAVPATIAVLNGKVRVGLDAADLERLANLDHTRKISRRDFGLAIARGETGGTTVSGTLIAAQTAGIRVFATGGIGGVHRDAPFDVSADLRNLGQTPCIVVCAGAKAILDLPATLEVLETEGVPVIGYGTDEFPAFYSQSSGLPVTQRLETPADVARVARAHWAAGINGALLVVVPPPDEVAIPADQVEGWLAQALDEAEAAGVSGSLVTPYLLSRMAQLSGGETLRANLGLLRNNARVAAQIAVSLANTTKPLI
jgi:pseudouridine-5'-phosphate glycosidase